MNDEEKRITTDELYRRAKADRLAAERKRFEDWWIGNVVVLLVTGRRDTAQAAWLAALGLDP